MSEHEKVNILLVDDQPAKLLSYEVILHELGENLIKASSGQEALEYLLKSEVAVVLMDVCMPDLDGFQLAAMIREHPRFQKTAMIFISAIHLTDMDRLRGYEMGAVDYVPVPVIPEVLRAKVKVFVELYRKTRQLERMNAELEQRVSARTAELEASTAQLRQSEESRSLALAAGNMGSWDWNRDTGECLWDDGQYGIFGVNRKHFGVTAENVRALIHPEDWHGCKSGLELLLKDRKPIQNEFRVKRPNGEVRWCIGTAAPSIDACRPRRADQRRDGGHHRSKDRRRTAGAPRPRGGSPRQECAGAGAIDRAPDPGAAISLRTPRRSKGGSGRCRGRTPSCRCRAGRARISAASSKKNWRRTGPAKRPRSKHPDRTCRCNRRPRSRSRLRCTSS